MKTFTYKSSYGFEYPNCYFVTGRYSENNNLAVRIMNDSEGPICTVTVNLCRKINDDCIVVKDYSDYFKVPISYDLMGNLFYAKDNVLYKKNYGYYDFIKKINIDDSISKIDGNYEGEKILKIYNQRIVKTTSQ